MTIFIVTPILQGSRVESIYCASLMKITRAARYQDHAFVLGLDNIAYVRNRIANFFLTTAFDTLVMIDPDIGFTLEDFDWLMSGDEQAVTTVTPDAYGGRPFAGNGFCRINRSAFDALGALTHDDGTERLGRYYEGGAIRTDYFMTGATGENRYLSDAQGFWSLVAIADVSMRLETRTQLRRVGPQENGIVPPDPLADARPN